MMDELIGTQAEDFHDLGVESIEGPPGEGGDDMIEGRPIALHAGGNVGGQRAVTIVAQTAARRGDRRGQIGA